MAIEIKHDKVATIPDDPDVEVGSDEWNEAHAIAGKARSIVMRDASTAGDMSDQAFSDLTEEAAPAGDDMVLGAKGASAGASQGALRKFQASRIAKRAPQSFIVACSDETSEIATGSDVITLRMPYAFALTAVRASLTTASSSGAVTVDIKEGGVSILSTPITIDANERTSATAATPPVIGDASLADDAEITIDIVGAGTGATGLKVMLIGHPA